MNDIETETGLRDYYQSITPVGSMDVVRLVDSAIRARRGAPSAAGRSRPRMLAGIAAVLTVAVVGGVCFSAWRAGPDRGIPGLAESSPSTSGSIPESPSLAATIGPVLPSPTETATPQPLTTLRAATESTPSHHFSLTGAPDGTFDTATLLQDGRVLLTGQFTRQTLGGFNVSVWTTAAALYDPATGKFSPTGSLVRAQGGGSTTLLADGRVLVAGGVAYSNSGGKLAADKLAEAELYDPATGRFTTTGSMGAVRADQAAALLADGDVLIAGGDDLSRSLATAELYDPSAGTFKPTGSMTEGRSQGKAIRLDDGRVLIYGGFGPSGPSSTAQLYDPETGRFTAIAWPAGGLAPNTASVTLLPDGRLLVAGGSDGTSSVATAQLFDPTTGTWSPTGSMATPREDHSAVLLADGTVLIAGGITARIYGDVNSGRPAAPGESGQAIQLDRYDSARGGSSTGPEVFGATGPAPTYLTSAELYDPTTGKFSATGAMRIWIANPVAITLLDGRVLFIGQDANSREAAELYQP